MRKLQELRGRRQTLTETLTGLQKPVAERRSAGKAGAELWRENDAKTFESAKTELATVNEQISDEERSEELEKFLHDAGEQRSQQRTPSGKADPRLSDQIPGGYSVEFGDVYRDCNAARAAAQRRSCGRPNRTSAKTPRCPSLATLQRAATAAAKSNEPSNELCRDCPDIESE